MEFLDLSLHRPVDNIAIDEALLEEAEQIGSSELLRIWETTVPVVVLGRSSPIRQEVNLEYCRSHQIDVFRRCSGGASVVASPGCLMYAVLLDYQKRPQLRMLEAAHQFVMSNLQAAMNQLGFDVNLSGTCDLTIGDRKFSGNALRCKRNWMMYHGTILCRDANLELIQNCLGRPKREPDYRAGRSHLDFLTQLPIDIGELKQSIIQTWGADQVRTQWPSNLTRQLVEQKYSTDAWTNKI